MEISAEELKDAIDTLESALYNGEELSERKIEKIRDLLADILDQLDE